MTADDLIEQLAAQSASPASVYVATADQAERDTIEAAGARAVSPQQLAEWIERVMREQDGALTEQRKRTEREWRRGGHG
jgi:predicted RNA-binding protein with PIN domain